jgi:hypothetical protein
MKHRYLLLLVSGIVLGLNACNKGKSVNSYPVNGKWLENKVRLYGDSSGVIYYDTTYTQPFTPADYIQFNGDGTCITSSDHYYYPNISNYPKTPQAIPATTGQWNFKAISSSKYVLTQQTQLVNPGGFDIRDTVEMINQHLLKLHVVSYSHVPGYAGITDSYFTK